MRVDDYQVSNWLHQIADSLPKGATVDEAVCRIREFDAGLKCSKEPRLATRGGAGTSSYPGLAPPGEPDPKKRQKILLDLVERMSAHPIAEGALSFPRDELHERD